MANRTPEQDLIDQFVDHLKSHQDKKLKIKSTINKSCKSRKSADVEFKSEANLHWVIEAKSHESKDRHNTVHKIFGELLKETGRTNRSECHYAILIPKSAISFYSKAFQSINKKKFIMFGKLIPISTVFTCDDNGIDELSWESLYDAYGRQ